MFGTLRPYFHIEYEQNHSGCQIRSKHSVIEQARFHRYGTVSAGAASAAPDSAAAKQADTVCGDAATLSISIITSADDSFSGIADADVTLPDTANADVALSDAANADVTLSDTANADVAFSDAANADVATASDGSFADTTAGRIVDAGITVVSDSAAANNAFVTGSANATGTSITGPANANHGSASGATGTSDARTGAYYVTISDRNRCTETGQSDTKRSESFSGSGK
jgi:hypothetical protein